jgi:hypothetical protein
MIALLFDLIAILPGTDAVRPYLLTGLLFVRPDNGG